MMKKIILAVGFFIIPGLGFASDIPFTWFLFYENPMIIEDDTDNGMDEMITDKIIVKGIKNFEKNKIGYTGTYHPNQAVDGSYLECLESNPGLYTCVTKKNDNQFVTFDLSIIINSASHSYISSGYFGTGLTFDKSLAVSDSKKYFVTGYQETEPGTAAIYNKKDTETGENGELDIPNVKYQNSHYRVILEDNRGDLNFKLKISMPLVALEKSEAVYSETESKLNIPVVEYNGTKYRVVLLNTPDEKGNFVFTVKEAELLPES